MSNYYHYHDNGDLVRIKAKMKPSYLNRPISGTWVLEEYSKDEKKWVMPPMPEITWGTLNQLVYLGHVRVEK